MKTNIKATICALATLVTANAAYSQNPEWPLAGPDRDLLHNFGTGLFLGFIIPSMGFFEGYFHEGVDILGDDLVSATSGVYCMRAGEVKFIGTGLINSGGTVLVEVPVAGGGVEWDSYLHIDIGPLMPGDMLNIGDPIGRIRSDFFTTDPSQGLYADDHLHINRFSSWGGGNGYILSRANMLNPLEIFNTAAERDPQLASPVLSDEDGDLKDFEIVESATSQPAGVDIGFAWNDVDFLVDAGDDQSISKPFSQAPSVIGYWVDGSPAGGASVASASTPYLLGVFGDNWRDSLTLPNVDSVFADFFDLNGMVQGYPAINTFRAMAVYRLTNTSGTDGLASSVDKDQFWNTDIRTIGTQANGSDAPNDAIEIQEALFPDGPYDVHVLLGDVVGNRTDTIRVVQVDNYRPYVSGIAIRSSVSPGAYRAAWLWNAAAGQLQIAPAQPSAPTFSGSGDVLITVVFSEPVASASIPDISPSVGFLPTLTEITSSNGKIWTGVIPESEIADDGSENGLHTLSIRAEDLNGSPIWNFPSTMPVTAPFNKRTSSNAISAPNDVDNLHFFVIG